MAVLPARSVTVTMPVTSLPSVVNTKGLVGRLLSTPESASAAVYGTDTSVLFQPAALGAGIAVPQLKLGVVLSILKADEVNVAMFPAMSVTVTMPVTLLPSTVSIKGLSGRLLSTLESASSTV